MDNLSKELLQAAPKAFETAHNLLGFDFCKPYTILKTEKPFTINSVSKVIGSENFIVFIKSTETWNREKFYFAEIKKGVLNIDFSVFNGNIDGFYRKGDFETYRKKNTIAYFISQAPELKTPVQPRENCNGVPMNYKTIKYTPERDKINAGKEIYISSVYGRGYTIIFDKSGYRIDEKRNNLIQAAKKLRSEREKTAANVVNVDAHLLQLEKDIKALQKQLAQTLENSNLIFDHFAELQKQVERFKWLVFDFDLFQKNYSEKKFSSPERLYKRLYEIGDKRAEISNAIKNNNSAFKRWKINKN